MGGILKNTLAGGLADRSVFGSAIQNNKFGLVGALAKNNKKLGAGTAALSAVDPLDLRKRL